MGLFLEVWVRVCHRRPISLFSARATYTRCTFSQTLQEEQSPKRTFIFACASGEAEPPPVCRSRLGRKRGNADTSLLPAKFVASIKANQHLVSPATYCCMQLACLISRIPLGLLLPWPAKRYIIPVYLTKMKFSLSYKTLLRSISTTTPVGRDKVYRARHLFTGRWCFHACISGLLLCFFPPASALKMDDILRAWHFMFYRS